MCPAGLNYWGAGSWAWGSEAGGRAGSKWQCGAVGTGRSPEGKVMHLISPVSLGFLNDLSLLYPKLLCWTRPTGR